MTPQGTFDKLRPICVAITKRHSIEDIRRLSDELENSDKGDIERLHEYILFPLRYILKLPPNQKPSQETCEATVKCITQVIEFCSVSKWELLQDLLTHLTVLISCPTNYGQVNTTSEELKTAIVSCIKTLIKQSPWSVSCHIYKDNFLPALGHCISILLSLAEREKLRDLRIQAMQCVLCLAQYEELLSSDQSHQVSDVFASFLPGIAISMCRIATGDSKQGISVISNAINVWSKVVTMVMSDVSLEWLSSNTNKTPALSKTDRTVEKRNDNSQTKSDSKSTESGRELRVRRTTDWVKNTGQKLNILISKMVILRSNSSWKIRLAMMEFAESLLLHCTRSLSDSVSSLLEVLVGLVGDEYPQVAMATQTALEKFSASHLHEESKTLVEILEENLHNLMTSLPRLMRTSDDSHKLSTLNLVLGYLKLLGNKVNILLYSVSHLKRLSTALIQVLELDTCDVKIVEEKTPLSEVSPVATVFMTSSSETTSPTQQHYLYRRKKYFKHFRDDKIYDILIQICRLLGFYGDIQLLMDHFVDKFRESGSQRKQAILIINEILMGATGEQVPKTWKITETETKRTQNKDINMESIVRALLEEYISPPNWNLQTSNQSEILPSKKSISDRLLVMSQERAGLSLGTLHNNILQICLLLEGISTFAKVLGSDFNLLLIQSLYPVFEKIGDETAVISQTAYGTLIDICTSCNYQSIAHLIRENSDYLVDAISHNLRHLDWNPKSPDVLKVMLQYGNADILPLTQDIIDEILDSLDQHYDQRAVLFMKVLHTLVCAIARWFPYTKDQTEPTESNIEDGENLRYAPEDKKRTSQSLEEFILEYIRQKTIADGEITDGEGEEEMEEPKEGAKKDVNEDAESDSDLNEADMKAELPLHINVIKQILERCLHFLSSKNPRLRLLVLDVVKHSVLVLQQMEDELLPLVHKIWPPMIQRFVDEEQFVTIKAFQTLLTMGKVSGDFIKRRVVKDVLPKLVNFLEKQATISIKSGPAYKHTIGYKQQLSILSGIGQLCIQLDIGCNECTTIANACLPYLSVKQPISLQQAAIDVFECLITTEPDMIWLLLSDTYTPSPVLEPPSQGFQHIKFAGTDQEKNEYAKNVGRLLKKL
ncbi:TELO2-interacting protein 1 homolog isoform X2 [Glandiceps talaboti]